MKTLEELLPSLAADFANGKPPVCWPTGLPIDFEPGQITLLAGAPGSGKTALAMQLIVDAIRSNDSLRALIVNVEMTPKALNERQAARIAGINLTRLRKRELRETEREKLPVAVEQLQAIAPRLAFAEEFDIRSIVRDANTHEAGIVCFDYLQRIQPRTPSDDQRMNLDSLMGDLRRIASEGACVVGVSAVARQKENTGSGYKELNLASFRGSSELEYGADKAYLLNPRADDRLFVDCVKDRHGEPTGFLLRFHRWCQRFEVSEPPKPSEPTVEIDFNSFLADDPATTATTTEGAADV
jgi:replicative DNA helicase